MSTYSSFSVTYDEYNVNNTHLLKFAHRLHDREGHKAELFFLRDLSKREVDFLVTIDGKPWFAVEAKSQDESASAGLRYFRDKLKIPFSYQALRKSGVDKLVDGVRVLSADRLLLALV